MFPHGSSTTSPTPTLPGRTVRVSRARPVGFGSLPAGAPIPYLNLSTKFSQVLEHAPALSMRWFNLSMEDWLSRLQIVATYYLPQSYIAVRDKVHTWETNGRNAVSWVGALALGVLVKNQRVGLNPVLNELMEARTDLPSLLNKRGQHLRDKHLEVVRDLEKRQADGKRIKTLQRTLGSLEKRIERNDKAWRRATDPGRGFSLRQSAHNLLNRFRLEEDYFDLLQKAGIRFKDADRRGAHWSALEGNELKTLANYLKALPAEHPDLIPLNKMTKRMNFFRLLATLIHTAIMTYVLGGLVMRFVYNVFAPLDADFKPDPAKGGGEARVGIWLRDHLHGQKSAEGGRQ
ncbi:MAG: hypothetical protein AB7P76_08185 [Candidatus Melainabacteria bacterium]